MKLSISASIALIVLSFSGASGYCDVSMPPSHNPHPVGSREWAMTNRKIDPMNRGLYCCFRFNFRYYLEGDDRNCDSNNRNLRDAERVGWKNCRVSQDFDRECCLRCEKDLIKAGTYYLRSYTRNQDSLVCLWTSDSPHLCCGAGPYYDDQLWTLTPVGNGGSDRYTITNLANKRVLGVEDGKIVAQPGRSDVWQFSYAYGGTYQIRHVASNMNLASLDSWNTGIAQPGYNEDQLWLVVPGN